jgi:pimeloyl-ACP methyl ester carboxylesterase
MTTADPGPSIPFGVLNQADAGDLCVGYAEAGPSDGQAVLLLHGWPYDIHSYAEVAPVLAAEGYRVIVPYLRGYGTTRFLSAVAPTITLEGDAHGAPHPDPSAYQAKFTGKYAHRTISGGVGHNLPQEAPQAFAEAVIDVASF